MAKFVVGGETDERYLAMAPYLSVRDTVLPAQQSPPSRNFSLNTGFATVKVVSQNLAAAFTFFGARESARSTRNRSEPFAADSLPVTASSNKAIEDTFQISVAAEAKLAAEDDRTNRREDQDALATESPSGSEETEAKGLSESGKTDASSSSTSPTSDLSEEEREVVDELKSIDREVRSHEQAHLAAAGTYAKGGPTYSFQQGPDGQQYAVGGEVAIDTSPVSGDPEATIEKARIIRAAASAPAEPSAQDRSVAAAATQLEAQATQSLRQQVDEEATEDEPTTGVEQAENSRVVTTGLLLDLSG